MEALIYVTCKLGWHSGVKVWAQAPWSSSFFIHQRRDLGCKSSCSSADLTYPQQAARESAKALCGEAWWCCCTAKQADGDPWDAAGSNLVLERAPGVLKNSRKPTFPTFEWTDLICPSSETKITSIAGSWLSSVLLSGLSSTILEKILREFDVFVSILFYFYVGFAHIELDYIGTLVQWRQGPLYEKSSSVYPTPKIVPRVQWTPILEVSWL